MKRSNTSLLRRTHRAAGIHIEPARAVRERAPADPLASARRVEVEQPAPLATLVREPECQRPGPRPLVIAIHGISRHSSQHLRLMSNEAGRRGFVLAAPHFDRETYPDYQRLGRRGRGARADRALLSLISRLRREGLVGEEVYLAGYSGGAQFVHRFTMAWPEVVTAAVCASAGWYTLPDAGTAYPYGIRSSARLTGVHFDPAAFLSVPMLAAVGARDVREDRALRRSERLLRTQGPHRVARAAAWVSAMQGAAHDRGLPTRARLAVLANAGHSFRSCVRSGLDRLAFDFFCDVHAGRRAHDSDIRRIA